MSPPSSGASHPGPLCLLTSMTRIAGLKERPFQLAVLPREDWSTGDYVAGEVLGRRAGGQAELPSGRMIEATEGDLLVGAFGSRFATLEATGSWENVGGDGVMDLLTSGGLMGKVRSLSTLIPEPVSLRYAGHVLVGGEKLTMAQQVRRPLERRSFRTPVILLLGTSMSAGKTTAARIIIRRLKALGRTVLGAKVAGAGRYRDILGMKDAGADAILDFVDAGIPSTHCSPAIYTEVLDLLLGRMAEVEVDVAVVEVGASPLEPYNGDLAVDALRPLVAFSVLCASDPYAVLGAVHAYGFRPDLVTGTTANTEAGVQLANRLTDLPVLDLRRKHNLPELDRRLMEALPPA